MLEKIMRYSSIVILFFIILLTPAFSVSAEEGEKYKIIFDANGGSFGIDTDENDIIKKEFEITKGESIDISKYVPARDGYSFEGWKKETSTEDSYFRYGNSTPDGDTTYIAGWKKICTITLDANSGFFYKTIDKDITEVKLSGTIGEYIDINEVPQKEGYYFIGYKELSTGKMFYSNQQWYVTSDTVWIAQWGKWVKLTYVNGKDTVELKTYIGANIPVGQYVYYEGIGSISYITPKVSDGYVFTGWKAPDGKTYVYDDKYKITEDITFEAQIKKYVKLHIIQMDLLVNRITIKFLRHLKV